MASLVITDFEFVVPRSILTGPGFASLKEIYSTWSEDFFKDPEPGMALFDPDSLTEIFLSTF